MTLVRTRLNYLYLFVTITVCLVALVGAQPALSTPPKKPSSPRKSPQKSVLGKRSYHEAQLNKVSPAIPSEADSFTQPISFQVDGVRSLSGIALLPQRLVNGLNEINQQNGTLSIPQLTPTGQSLVRARLAIRSQAFKARLALAGQLQDQERNRIQDGKSEISTSASQTSENTLPEDELKDQLNSFNFSGLPSELASRYQVLRKLTKED